MSYWASVRKEYDRRKKLWRYSNGSVTGWDRQGVCLVVAEGSTTRPEDAALRAIGLREKGGQFEACRAHRVLGKIYQSKGQTEKATHHFKVALENASAFNWSAGLFWVHHNLAYLFHKGCRFDNEHAHIEQAKSHAGGGPYLLGHVMEMRARVLYGQERLEEARSEALYAADIFEKLAVAENTEFCRKLLQRIEDKLNNPVASGQSVFDCELPQTLMLPPASINRPF